jgi:predicted lipoprotein
MTRLLASLFLLLSLTPLAAQESVTVRKDVDYRAAALHVIEDFAQPRYEALWTRTKAQRAAWDAFCAAEPSEDNFGQLTTQFVETVNAWSSIEILRYGPVSEDFRYERIAYWPERKNDVARGLQKLLSESDVLTPESVRAKSVAVQGLSVLERLLYDKDNRASLTTKGAGGKRRCAAGSAVAGNLENVAREIVEAWPAVKDKIRAEGSPLPREAVTRFATDLLTVYQVVGDLKLDAPMGKTPAEAKPKAAQWWRSGLSSQTLALNLQSAADLSWIVLGPGDAGTSVVNSIETAQRLAENLPLPLSEMVTDDVQRKNVVLLRDAVRGARDLSGAYVPASLGITLGFNSLDGD